MFRAALSHITLPDGGRLIDSARLSAPVFDESGTKLSAALTIAAHEAAAFAPIRAAAEAAALTLAGVSKAVITLIADATAHTGKAQPVKPQPAKPVPQLNAAPKAAAPQLLPDVGMVVAVASGKGGVGKSTTTVNLALALREAGLKVGILDADIYGPSLPTLLGLTGKPRMAADGRRLLPMEAWGVKALSVGNLVDPDTAMIWRGPMITAAITQLVAEVDWGRLDVLLIDMPPGTGDAQLAVAQNSPLKAAIIVSTPQDLALIDARRGITMFQKLAVPVLGVIENMSHFLCPDCGGRHEIFGHGGAEAEAAQIDVPFLGAVPLTIDLRRSADLGRPLMATDPEGVVGQAFRAIASRVLAQLKTAAQKARATEHGDG